MRLHFSQDFCTYMHKVADKFFIVYDDFYYVLCKETPTVLIDLANAFNNWFAYYGGW